MKKSIYESWLVEIFLDMALPTTNFKHNKEAVKIITMLATFFVKDKIIQYIGLFWYL